MSWIDEWNKKYGEQSGLGIQHGGTRPVAGSNYAQSIPAAYQRYMDLIWGPGGQKSYVQKRVQGMSDAINPAVQQAYSQGASSVAARGGLAGGAADSIYGDITGKKLSMLGGAAGQAQGDVLNTNQALLGMAQREGFKLTDDELARLYASIQQQLADSSDDFDWGDLAGAIGAILGRA